MQNAKKSNKKTEETKQQKSFRSGAIVYDSMYCGISKYGFYVGLKRGDEVDFISGYESVGFINSIMDQFTELEVAYGTDISKNNKEYEVATLNRYTM